MSYRTVVISVLFMLAISGLCVDGAEPITRFEHPLANWTQYPHFWFCGDALVFDVDEELADDDIDGDGDLWFARSQYDLETGETVVLPDANPHSHPCPSPGDISGKWEVFGIDESTEGVDLNGDGDTDDTVLHVRNRETEETRNLGLAGYTEVSQSGDWLVFAVFEKARRGQGADLNHDDDWADSVLHVHNLETGETTNLEIVGEHVLLSGKWIIFKVPEFADETRSGQGEDLNGDGDTEDLCLHSYDVESGQLKNLAIAAFSCPPSGGIGCIGCPPTPKPWSCIPFVISGDWAAFVASEDGQRQDFNGDGDTEDAVLHTANLARGETQNLKLSDEDVGLYEFAGNWLVAGGADPDSDGAKVLTLLKNVETGESRDIEFPFHRVPGLAASYFDTVYFSQSWLGTWDEGFFYLHSIESGETTQFGFAAGDLLRGHVVLNDNWLAVSARASESDDNPRLSLLNLEMIVNLPLFRRGDANADAKTDLSDAVFVLNHLFLGGTAPSCDDSADADDNGALEITDGIYLLNYLFLGGPQPPAPFPDCGPDPTIEDPTELTCSEFPPCAEPG